MERNKVFPEILSTKIDHFYLPKITQQKGVELCTASLFIPGPTHNKVLEIVGVLENVGNCWKWLEYVGIGGKYVGDMCECWKL